MRRRTLATRMIALALLLICSLLAPLLRPQHGLEAAEPVAAAAAPGVTVPAVHPAPTGNAPPKEDDEPKAPPGLTAMLARRAANPNATFRSDTPIVLEFLKMGFTHIIPNGLDHILFMIGLFLLAPRLKPLLIQVTAFTVAHSITLGLCMAHVVELPARFVETTIALSIAFVAIENICYRDIKPWRWMVVFCFGLVHGLGFAELLKNLDMPHGTFFPALISFNLGVELGQLTIISTAAILTFQYWKESWYRSDIVIPSSIAIAAIGLFWAAQRGFGW